MINHATKLRTRERLWAILDLLSRGYTADEIAVELVVSRRTVEENLYKLRTWNGCETTVQLVALAVHDHAIDFKRPPIPSQKTEAHDENIH